MHRGGFSLLEMTIVLMVVSTILASLLPAITEGTKVKAIEETTRRMKAIEDAIQAYYATNVTIPCAAPINAAVNTAAFGVEDSGATCQAGAAATRYGVSGNVVGGAVPTKTLGLPDDYAFDGWGRRIAYHVDHRATESATFWAAGGITVNGDTGTRTTAGVYALISSGRNGHGGYTRGGSPFNSGSTNAHELENCQRGSAPCAGAYNATFVQKMEKSDDVADPTDRFDDIVIYKLLGHITGGGSSDTLWARAGANIYNTNTGNVGIGTTTPSSPLTVRGPAVNGNDNNPILIQNMGAGVGTATGLFFDPNGNGIARAASVRSRQSTAGTFANLEFYTANGTNPAEVMRITPAGNVGIGTVSPNSLLEVYGVGAAARVDSPAAASNPYFEIRNTGVRQGYFGFGAVNSMTYLMSDYNLGFGSGSAERARILVNGNFGINHTNPTSRLHVLQTAATQSAIHGSYDGGGTSYYGIQGTAGAFWAGLGRNDGYSIVGNGNAWLNGTFYASDVRLKENISDINDGLNKIMAMHPVHYTWKPDAEQARLAGKQLQAGLIAQEVETIAPEVVTTMKVPTLSPIDKEGDLQREPTLNESLGETKGVDYTKIVPYLIGAVQELNAKVDALAGGKRIEPEAVVKAEPVKAAGGGSVVEDEIAKPDRQLIFNMAMVIAFLGLAAYARATRRRP